MRAREREREKREADRQRRGSRLGLPSAAEGPYSSSLRPFLLLPPSLPPLNTASLLPVTGVRGTEQGGAYGLSGTAE